MLLASVNRELHEKHEPSALADGRLSISRSQPQAPVVARAAFLLECAHFVHRCNRGQWPSWMKLNLPFYRPSGPLSNRGTPSGQRRTHILQRLGGRMFFSWAEVRQSTARRRSAYLVTC